MLSLLRIGAIFGFFNLGILYDLGAKFHEPPRRNPGDANHERIC